MDQHKKLVDSIAPAVECSKLGSLGWLVELCGWAGWQLVAGMFAHPLARMMQNKQIGTISILQEIDILPFGLLLERRFHRRSSFPQVL